MTTDMIVYGIGNLILIVLLIAYGLIVVLCIAETMLEIIRSGARWDRWKVLGLALSFAWPVLVAFLACSRFFGTVSGRTVPALRETVD